MAIIIYSLSIPVKGAWKVEVEATVNARVTASLYVTYHDVRLADVTLSGGFTGTKSAVNPSPTPQRPIAPSPKPAPPLGRSSGHNGYAQRPRRYYEEYYDPPDDSDDEYSDEEALIEEEMRRLGHM